MNVKFFLSIFLLVLFSCFFPRHVSAFSDTEEEAAPSLVFVRFPDMVTKGNRAALRWEAQGAAYCLAAGGWKGKKSAIGMERVRPSGKNKIYSLECFDEEGNRSKKISVSVAVVKKLPRASPVPKITLTLERDSLSQGDSTTVRWNAPGAMNCEAGGAAEWEGLKYPQGEQELQPEEDQTYTLKCWGRSGKVSQSAVSVHVEQLTVKIPSPSPLPTQPQEPAPKIPELPKSVTPGEPKVSKEQEKALLPPAPLPSPASIPALPPIPSEQPSVTGSVVTMSTGELLRASQKGALLGQLRLTAGSTPAAIIDIIIKSRDSSDLFRRIFSKFTLKTSGNNIATVSAVSTQTQSIQFHFQQIALPANGFADFSLFADVRPNALQDIPDGILLSSVLAPDGKNILSAPLPFASAGVATTIPECKGTIALFKETGKITCGHIMWDLTPESAKLFQGDPRTYLMKYDTLYLFYKDWAGIEPHDNKVTIKEIPNNPYPADADWANSTIHASSLFVQEHMAYFGNTLSGQISLSFMHEMGHIFSLTPANRNAYIWKDMTEGYANIQGILPYLMAHDDGSMQLVQDAWCRETLHKSWPCDADLTRMDESRAGGDRDFAEYNQLHETFANMYITPRADWSVYRRGGIFEDMLVEVFRDFRSQGRGPVFVDAFKKTQQFYTQNSALIPKSWLVSSQYEFGGETIAKANFYIYLLSAYSGKDLSARFEGWNIPMLQEVKIAITKAVVTGANLADQGALLKKLGGEQALSGGGLTGDYYNNRTWQGTPALTRVDSVVDMIWDGTAPGAGVNSNNYSVKWQGTVTPKYSEEYTFSIISDDGARLTVNGQKLFEDMTEHAPLLQKGKIVLKADEPVIVNLEYFQGWFGAGIRLAWSSVHQAEQIIPSENLAPLMSALYKPGIVIVTVQPGTTPQQVDEALKILGIRRDENSWIDLNTSIFFKVSVPKSKEYEYIKKLTPLPFVQSADVDHVILLG